VPPHDQPSPASESSAPNPGAPQPQASPAHAHPPPKTAERHGAQPAATPAPQPGATSQTDHHQPPAPGQSHGLSPTRTRLSAQTPRYQAARRDRPVEHPRPTQKTPADQQSGRKPEPRNPQPPATVGARSACAPLARTGHASPPTHEPAHASDTQTPRPATATQPRPTPAAPPQPACERQHLRAPHHQPDGEMHRNSVAPGYTSRRAAGRHYPVPSATPQPTTDPQRRRKQPAGSPSRAAAPQHRTPTPPDQPTAAQQTTSHAEQPPSAPQHRDPDRSHSRKHYPSPHPCRHSPYPCFSAPRVNPRTPAPATSPDVTVPTPYARRETNRAP